MVFLGGPRQVGKTTLAKALLKARGVSENYLNWDAEEDRARILGQKTPVRGLVVFDEIHKFTRWRAYLKGIYDKKDDDLEVLVTGSARLDLYRRGGDSLQGRYHFLRMYPLSVAELKLGTPSDFEGLLTLGGFPEPYFRQEKTAADRWTFQYRGRLLRDEVSSLEKVQDVTLLELLSNRLPECVGSALSINALREDLQVAHQTVKRWLEIFERLYLGFFVRPFGAPSIKAVKKESKFYLFDWNAIEDPGARLENLVAVHLLKWAHWQEDVFGLRTEVRFFRDIEGREVDFVVTQKGKPVFAIECKLTDIAIHKPLEYFKRKFPNVRALQLTLRKDKRFTTAEGIEVLHVVDLLKDLL